MRECANSCLLVATVLVGTCLACTFSRTDVPGVDNTAKDDAFSLIYDDTSVGGSADPQPDGDGSVDMPADVSPDMDTDVCMHTTCAAEGKNCGSIPDGCGNTLNRSCGVPGTGEIRSQSAFVLPDNTMRQGFWRGGQGWTRIVPLKADGTPDWDNAGDWNGPLAP